MNIADLVREQQHNMRQMMKVKRERKKEPAPTDITTGMVLGMLFVRDQMQASHRHDIAVTKMVARDAGRAEGLHEGYREGAISTMEAHNIEPPEGFEILPLPRQTNRLTDLSVTELPPPPPPPAAAPLPRSPPKPVPLPAMDALRRSARLPATQPRGFTPINIKRPPTR
jgi:hypothetical protein